VEKLEADRFHLVVVGEFNHGKTTFVNGLLGKTLLPSGVTPTTAIIHHVEYAEEPSAAVVFHDGERRPLGIDQVGAFSVGGDHGAAGGIVRSGEEVRHLEVFVPAKLLAERIVLVDTPGVNDLSHQRADITYSYIPKSDAVLFLLDAGQPLKESERVFLQEKLLAKERNKIVFVVTKRDIWDASEQVEAMRYVRTEVDKLLPGAPVFAVSALEALEGARERSGLPELEAHLFAFLSEERGRILLDNALGQALALAAMLGKGVEAKRRSVAMPAEELDRRIEVLEQDLAGASKTIEQRRAEVREEIAAIRAWVRRDLEHFQEDVIKSLPSMIDEAKPDELKTHLGPFLERTVVEWAERETKEIAKALEGLAEKTIALVREDANASAQRLSSAFGKGLEAPVVEVDTLRYDFGVVALAAVGVGIAFTNLAAGVGVFLAAPVLAVYVRRRIERETREKARELAPAAIREAAAKLGPKLDEMILAFANALDQWVVTAGEELHREMLEILRKTRETRSLGASEEASTIARCDRERDELHALEAKLSSLRASLGSGQASKPVE
jgi:signal recognition particle receptor subunit beta